MGVSFPEVDGRLFAPDEDMDAHAAFGAFSPELAPRGAEDEGVDDIVLAGWLSE